MKKRQLFSLLLAAVSLLALCALAGSLFTGLIWAITLLF